MMPDSPDISTDQEPTAPPHVLRWERPDTEHRVIAELRVRREAIEAGAVTGTEWGVIQDSLTTGMFVSYNEAVHACKQHAQIELEGSVTAIHARWLTDEEHAAKVAEALAKPPSEAESRP